MSDSDDTDVLLLIPPDLFIVPSSDSEDNLDQLDLKTKRSGVVSELIDHMQSLESRISAIESRDSPTNSLNLSHCMSLESIMSCRQTIPRTKFSVSRNSSLQSTPTKHSQCFSLPSTPNIRQKLNHTNEKHHHVKLDGSHHSYKRDSNFLTKHDHSKLFSEPLLTQNTLKNKSSLHAGVGSSEKESRLLLSSALNVSDSNISCNVYKPLSPGHFSSDQEFVKDISLPQVNKLLQKIDSNDKNVVSKTCNSNGYLLPTYTGPSNKTNTCEVKRGNECTKNKMEQKQKFVLNDHNTLHETMNSFTCGKQTDLRNCSLPDSSFSSFNTDRFMSEFKTWNPSFSQDVDNSKISMIDLKNFEDNAKFINKEENVLREQLVDNTEKNDFSVLINSYEESRKENNNQQINTNFHLNHTDGTTKSQMLTSIPNSTSCQSIFKTPSNLPVLDSFVEKTEQVNGYVSDNNYKEKSSTSIISDTKSSNKRPQRLLTLSDIWNQDSSKPEEERLRLKLEEEKFRREHCEELIQELQKTLLEQQEKIAVAIRVDNEKNSFISQFQVSWKKMKQKLHEFETERESLQKVLKGISEKHQIEIVEYQKQIMKYKEELSKALNLASGYKEKSDLLVEEKVELLKNHADELQNYKTLVQQADNSYKEVKTECQKLLEKNQQIDECLKNVQQDFNKELMKSSEVKDELSIIHKALDACEAELVILREEKENLQLKLKEENNRNNILEQGKNSYIKAVDEAKKAEKSAKNEIKSLTEQQEKLRAELRDVYQKQVDEVVKTKLQEFQTQLDSAEAVFQNEVETKQRAIAECAARKIKSVMDKHQLEIHLVEEKHKEEKKLFEIKLAQAVQKSAILETQLNSYRKSKSQLVEQLHSMMQKQWQQALVIISGGNSESIPSFQKINVDKLFDFPNEENLELIPEHCSTLRTDQQTKSATQKNINLKSLQAQEVQNESLITLTSNEDTPLSSRKESKSDITRYIKMILDMQQKDNHLKSKLPNDNATQKEVSCEQLRKNSSTTNEGNSKWQPISEVSIHDTSEYLSMPQKFTFKSDHSKEKPPWK